jgi:predicted ATPase
MLIKFDLHIHSIASKYKEADQIVDESTIENIDVLFSKLEEHQISLFSITDHNRFDPDLYVAIDLAIKKNSQSLKYVNNIVSGVEFDVQLDPTMNKCHIITIFDAKNEYENYLKIYNSLSNNCLSDPQDFYTKEMYEKILNEIGLDTILIACQRKDIGNHNGKHSSLSDSSNQVEEIISIGYINALEYQKPKVEGILINNLKEIPRSVSLISGSDCHTWSCYPKHDASVKKSEFYPSKAKILPTFKGLLMAITSPESRFNYRQNSNTVFFNGLTTNNGEIKFENGINALIGENGAGKSTVLKALMNQSREPYIKKIMAENEINLHNSIQSDAVEYIGQGSIVDRFNTNSLFKSMTDSNFTNVDNSEFIESYTKYAEDIKYNIELSIRQTKAITDINEKTFEIREQSSINDFYIQVICPVGFDDVENIHEEPLGKIKRAVRNLESLRNEDYFSRYESSFEAALAHLREIFSSISKDHTQRDSERKVKNIIQSCTADYNRRVESLSTSAARDISDYRSERESFISLIAQAAKLKNLKHRELTDPPPLSGISINPKKGFSFNTEAEYHNRQMKNDFLIAMFNQDFSSTEAIQNIVDETQYVEAVRNCTKRTDLDRIWIESFEKFIHQATAFKQYITDSQNKEVGNTLGELSLTYLKYSTQERDTWNVFIVDQPEDNISNHNISTHLIDYLNSIRDSKQIIIVTHNPLLVVNLDVDNVIFLEKIGKEIKPKCGCLEYESENFNMLSLIADNMDGGRESIEKRLRVYGK